MLFIKHKIHIRQCLAAGFVFLVINSSHAETAAHGEMYKWKNADGVWQYSNINPPKGATKLNLDPLNTVPATRPKTSVASPSNFPKVDGDTQKKRDDTRRRILEEELTAEEKLLTEATAKRDATSVALHEKNVAALKKELSNIK